MRTFFALTVFALGVYLIQIPPQAPAAPIDAVALPAVVEPIPTVKESLTVQDAPVCVNGQCSVPQATKKVVQSVLVRPVKHVTRSIKARPRLFGRLLRRSCCGG
jgi:hypothetical protein